MNKKVFVIIFFFILLFVPQKILAQENTLRIGTLSRQSAFSLDGYDLSQISPELLPFPPQYEFIVDVNPVIATVQQTSCNTSISLIVDYISEGSLVDSQGNLQVDIFFVGLLLRSLTQEEASELAAFMQAGGVVHLAAGSANLPQYGYEMLWQELGYENDYYENVYEELPQIPDYGEFDYINVQDLTHLTTPIINTPFEPGEFGTAGGLRYLFWYLGIHTDELDAQASSAVLGKTIMAGGQVGQGYLSVAAYPLYIGLFDFAGSSNMLYFRNMAEWVCQGKPGLNTNLDVPLLKQDDERWGAEIYNNYSTDATNQTISKWGCALTSAVMILNYYNHDIAPLEFNNWLKDNGGYTRAHGVKFPFVAAYAVRHKNISENKFGLEYIRQDYSVVDLRNEIEMDRPAVVEVKQSLSPSGVHFVVAKGESGEDFVINDPGSDDRTLLSDYVESISLRKFEPTYTDASYLLVYADPDITIKIFDSNNNEVVGTYEIEEPILSNYDDELAGETIGVYSFAKPPTDDYSVEITGDGGLYKIEIDLISASGETVVKEFDGIVSKNEPDIFQVGMNDLDMNKFVTIDSIISDFMLAYVQGFIDWRAFYPIRAKLRTAKRFYDRGNNRIYKRMLGNVVSSIEKNTPRRISQEVSDVLKSDIKLILNQ